MNALHDVRSAAVKLAVSPWTIRAYIRDGKLRVVRLGRLVRLEERELERFVSESQAPVVQIQKGEE
jgi:excisionase family DNA binding protein